MAMTFNGRYYPREWFYSTLGIGGGAISSSDRTDGISPGVSSFTADVAVMALAGGVSFSPFFAEYRLLHGTSRTDVAPGTSAMLRLGTLRIGYDIRC